jgi:D-sedoheptulose 7-phosphate isomerase
MEGFMSSLNTPVRADITSTPELNSGDVRSVEDSVSAYQAETAEIISQIPNAFKQKSKTENSKFVNFLSAYRIGLLKAFDGLDSEAITNLAEQIRSSREDGASIYVIGNGGSASTATHLAADLGKIRFQDERSFFRVTSLSDNTALVTATANDSGYSQVFAHQLKRFVRPGDIVIAISSSGNSGNIIEGLKAAKANGGKTWSIVGFTGGEASRVSDNQIYIPTNVGEYGFMEDVSSVIIHLLVNYIHDEDKKIFKMENS